MLVNRSFSRFVSRFKRDLEMRHARVSHVKDMLWLAIVSNIQNTSQEAVNEVSMSNNNKMVD